MYLHLPPLRHAICCKLHTKPRSLAGCCVVLVWDNQMHAYSSLHQRAGCLCIVTAVATCGCFSKKAPFGQFHCFDLPVVL